MAIIELYGGVLGVFDKCIGCGEEIFVHLERAGKPNLCGFCESGKELEK